MYILTKVRSQKGIKELMKIYMLKKTTKNRKKVLVSMLFLSEYRLFFKSKQSHHLQKPTNC